MEKKLNVELIQNENFPRGKFEDKGFGLDWVPLLWAPCSFSLEAFMSSCTQLIRNPEQTSTTILRAEILHESESEENVLKIRRKLVPKQTRDLPMDQDCVLGLYEGEGLVSCLLLPDLKDVKDGKLPFYHPQVSGILFRCKPSIESTPGWIQIDVSSLPNGNERLPNPIPTTHKVYRTGIILIRQLYQTSAGFLSGYEKRVHHDLLGAPKSEVQDLYRTLKEKYRTDIPTFDPRITFSWLLREWKENTDASKHVWEDVAIASWIILLWAEMYPSKRPRNFVDVGCGNGLLTYILTNEGYKGYGFDLRRRKTWDLFPDVDLRVETLDPVSLLEKTTDEWPFKEETFFIGNHADEMTPWIPLIAAKTPGCSFLNIPCCLHTFTEKFMAQTYSIPQDFIEELSRNTSTTTTELLEPFYAPTPSTSNQKGRYFAYQLYLAHITLQCGFIPEREALRIPSTKNFGMVGSKRLQIDTSKYIASVIEQTKGKWIARTPEGKNHSQ